MKVLLFVGGGVGNIVHCTCAVEAIRRTPHRLAVWAGGEWGGLAQFIDHDDVRTGEVPDVKDFDRVFRSPYAFTGADAHLAEQCPREAEPSPIPFDGLHAEVEACMWFARVVGYDGPTPPPKVRHAAASMVTSGGYIVIAPGVQSASAVWLKKKYSHFMEVAQTFLGKLIELISPSAPLPANREAGSAEHADPAAPDSPKIFYLGTKDDSEPWMDGLGVNLCGETSLWEASAVLANAKAVIGPDNGLTSLSAAMGIPTVVLWGPTSEIKNRKYGPHVTNIFSPLSCSPCQFEPAFTECQQANCMLAISPTMVAEAALKAIGGIGCA